LFISEFLQGKSKEYLKSERPPMYVEGSLQTAVQKTFDGYTKDKRRNCLMVIYSNKEKYCNPKCNDVIDIMQKLANDYEEDEREDVWFTKMNGLLNEVYGNCVIVLNRNRL